MTNCNIHGRRLVFCNECQESNRMKLVRIYEKKQQDFSNQFIALLRDELSNVLNQVLVRRNQKPVGVNTWAANQRDILERVYRKAIKLTKRRKLRTKRDKKGGK